MSFSPPPSKQAKQDCPISKLTDAELIEIFKRLAPCERLLISEVCRQWYGVSRMPWCDITALDLSPIPGAHIRVIIAQCPNLQSVFARGKCFDLDELSTLHQSTHLSCIKLYDCKFAVVAQGPMPYQGTFARVFSENLQHAVWNELVLHNERTAEKKLEVCGDSTKTTSVYGSPVSWWHFGAEQLPTSLTRLQLSGWRGDLVPSGISRLQDLECLILHSSLAIRTDCLSRVLLGFINFQGIVTLRNLRELFFGPATSFHFQLDLKLLTSNLPQLEVLFLISIYGTSIEQLTDLVTKRSALRVLVLAGECFPEPIEIPARKRYPNGFGSDPLPLLHIFVGNAFMQAINLAPSDAAIIHVIDAPMPEFLERKEIAEIFEGVWIAAKIKEAAKYGAELWNYNADGAAN